MDAVKTLDKLGDYTILERIGRGGMGVVYRARHDELGDVALKLMPGVSRGARTRLLQEAAVAASLDHPHVIRVYGFGEHRQQPYIVMELLDGFNLKTMIRYARELALEPRLEVIKQVLEALAYAHDAGVAHRDVKPQNIFLTRSGTVRVLDFGIARADDAGVGETRGLIGSPRYMPPECVEGREVDHRGDIFAVGTVFYELLSGSRAFTGYDVRQILAKVKSRDPVPVHRIDDRLPEELSAIVATAMTKDAEARYASMHELIAAVEQFEVTLAALREQVGDEIQSLLAPLGTIPPDDPGPYELQIPDEVRGDYLRLLSLRQRVHDHRQPLAALVGELAWVDEMLATPLEELEEDALRGIANRTDGIRDTWPGAPTVAELGHGVLQELRARVRRREPMAWSKAEGQPSKEVV
jgi:serine/threonine protein kinase